MITQLKRYWDEHPLILILIAGSFFRLLAVFFSRGWGMHDDHFLVIEAAQSWADGTDYNRWLPIEGNTTPPGHSFFYPGLHYLLFVLLRFTGLTDPQTKMIIVRFFHFLLSLSVIYLGFKITEKLSNKKDASLVGLLLALFWFMPFLSVRNLAEVVSIPFLMYSVFLIINLKLTTYDLRLTTFIAGLISGIAFSLRYQTIIFIGGIVLVMLIQKKWKESFFMCLGLLLSIIIFEGGIDYFVWHYPFADLMEYIKYNLDNAYNYLTLPWYHYIVFLSGILIPPVSIFLFFGFFRTWKKHLIIFLPTILFLIFHSYFPNKQERFILTIIPFIIITGVIGWNNFINFKFGIRNSKFIRYSWVFFWVLNIIALPVVSTVYSKKARAESMVYLSRYKNIDYLMQEGNAKLLPRFYLGQWVNVYEVSDDASLEQFRKTASIVEKEKLPKFVLFYEDKDLDNRVRKVKEILPGLKYETTIHPGFIDKLLFRLNPKNSNQTIYIYKNMQFYE